MKSRTTANFRQCLESLPPEIRDRARKAYGLFVQDPNHPSLRFKKVHPTDPIYSARVNRDYRALCIIAVEIEDRITTSVAVWFWIGSHADYDKMSG